MPKFAILPLILTVKCAIFNRPKIDPFTGKVGEVYGYNFFKLPKTHPKPPKKVEETKFGGQNSIISKITCRVFALHPKNQRHDAKIPDFLPKNAKKRQKSTFFA